jgi:hypothetical protein
MMLSIPALDPSERGCVSSPQWAGEASGGRPEAGAGGSSMSDSESGDSSLFDSALMSDAQNLQQQGGDEAAHELSDSGSEIESKYLFTQEEWRQVQEKEGAQFVAHLNPLSHLATQRNPKSQGKESKS